MHITLAVFGSLSQQMNNTEPSHIKLDVMLKMVELILSMILLGGVSTGDVNRIRSVQWQFTCHAAK